MVDKTSSLSNHIYTDDEEKYQLTIRERVEPYVIISLIFLFMMFIIIITFVPWIIGVFKIIESILSKL